MTVQAAPESPAATPRLPEPGQVVEVRGATWAVTDVVSQGLLRSPADEDPKSSVGLQHEGRLQSLDEDRMGEELSVVWELEVGNTVLPEQGLPESIQTFDHPATVGALGVMSSQVVQSRDRWLLPDRGVGPVVIVGVEPAREGCEAIGF